MQSRPLVSRNNPQIWRLAEYLDENIMQGYLKSDMPEYFKVVCWDKTSQIHKDYCYDKAAELLKKIENREFVGEDNHAD